MTRNRRRIPLLGALALVTILIVSAAVAFAIWASDDAPIDDSDLLALPPFVLPGEPTICDGLIELATALPPEPECFQLFLGDRDVSPPPWPPGPFDRKGWEEVAELNEEIRTHGESLGAALAGLDEVLARERFSSIPVLSYDDPSPGIREARELCDAAMQRALARRLTGDLPGSSRDLARLLRLGHAILEDGELCMNSFLVGCPASLGALEFLLSVLQEGALDPAVEDGILGTTCYFDRHPERISIAFRKEYSWVVREIEKLEASRQEGGLAIRYSFKPNTTRRWFAREFREAIIHSQLPRWRRPEPQDRDSEPRSDLEVRLHLNDLGASLYGLLSMNFESFLSKIDRGKATGRATRIIVALDVYRREHGELPTGLEELRARSAHHWAELPEALVDPFSGNPFRYDPGRGILWSVGTDGIDQGGKHAEELIDGTRERHELDDLIWLIPPRR